MDLVTLIILVEVLKINVTIANCISVILASYAAYILNVKFIFQNGKYGIKKEITYFYIFAAVSFILNVSFMYIVVELLSWWYITAKITVTTTIALFNFITRKWFIFVK